MIHLNVVVILFIIGYLIMFQSQLLANDRLLDGLNMSQSEVEENTLMEDNLVMSKSMDDTANLRDIMSRLEEIEVSWGAMG